MSGVMGLSLSSKMKEQVYPPVGGNYRVTTQVPRSIAVVSELTVSSVLMSVGF